jgi:hypothetical protein
MDDLCKNLFNGKNPVSVTLEKLCPGAQYTVQGYTMNEVVWNSPDIPKPTQHELDIALEQVIASQTQLNSWLPQRISAYPTIDKQLDMLYWDQVNGTNVWKNTISSIKQQFPKGS